MIDAIAEQMPIKKQSDFQKICQDLTSLRINWRELNSQATNYDTKKLTEDEFRKIYPGKLCERNSSILSIDSTATPLDKETVLNLLKAYQAELLQKKERGEEKETLPLTQCERAIELMIRGRKPHGEPNPASLLYTITNIVKAIKADAVKRQDSYLAVSTIREPNYRKTLTDRLAQVTLAKCDLADNIATFVADHAIEWAKGPQFTTV